MTNDKGRNMKVVLRVRPLNRSEMEQNQRTIIRVADDSTIIFDPDEEEDEFFFHGMKQTHRDITKRVHKKLTMTFDRVFDMLASNNQVFLDSMKPLVSSVINGYNCSAFVYGATGAGKTYTMLGSDENPGITYLTMKELFNQIDSMSEDRKFDIGISYLEVYNEQVMNLLTKTGPLRLREDGNGVVVSGLQLKPIHDADELLSLLALGNQNRTQHPTDANAESSRSHAIFQVHIRMTNKKTGEKRMVKLSMIDLAGSERGSSTKCVGQRFKEGASINKSLLALGNCINKLADGSKHIPYRDSNMTRILKDSLGGNCKTVMIANISPSSLTYEDTYNTLKYASRAQKIRTSVITKNVFKTNLPKEYYVRKLTEFSAENELLKQKILALENEPQASIRSKDASENSFSFDTFMAEIAKWQKKIDKVYNDLHSAQSSYFNLHSKEKILISRTKLKEQTEETKKLFNLNGKLLDRDLCKLEASIEQFSKQAEACHTDKARWMERYNCAKADLIQLKNLLTDKRIATLLHPYFKYKQEELEKAQLLCRSEHFSKINRIYSIELENSRKTIDLSGEIIQHTYLLLSANMMLTDDMERKMSQLYKLHHGQREVKFTNTNDKSLKSPNHHDDEDLTCRSLEEKAFEDEIEQLSTIDMNADDIMIAMPENMPSRAKRTLNIDDASTSEPKRFASDNLNVTQVLDKMPPTIKSTNTFRSKATVVPVVRKVGLSKALRETSSNICKDFVIPKLSIKPIINGHPQTPKEKENKRIVLVRSSPRRNSPSKMINKLKTKTGDIMQKRRPFK